MWFNKNFQVTSELRFLWTRILFWSNWVLHWLFQSVKTDRQFEYCYMHKSVVMATSVGSLSVVLQHYSTQCSKQSPVQIRSIDGNSNTLNLTGSMVAGNGWENSKLYTKLPPKSYLHICILKSEDNLHVSNQQRHLEWTRVKRRKTEKCYRRKRWN
jgi:hypothetical protein